MVPQTQSKNQQISSDNLAVTLDSKDQMMVSKYDETNYGKIVANMKVANDLETMS
jgi:hypothetical protein